MTLFADWWIVMQAFFFLLIFYFIFKVEFISFGLERVDYFSDFLCVDCSLFSSVYMDLLTRQASYILL